MIVVSVVAFGVLFLTLVEIQVRKSDFFSPARIFLLSHSVSLGVAFLAFDKAMTPFRPLTWVVYLGGCATFLLGAAWASGISFPGGRGRGVHREEPPSDYHWKVHLACTLALTALVVFGILGAYSGAGTFPALAANKTSGMKKFMGQPIYFVLPMAWAGIAMALLFMARFRPRRPRLPADPVVWLLVPLVGVYALVLSRIALAFFFFFAMVYYHLAVRKLSFGKVFAVLLGLFILVLVTGYYKVRTFASETRIEERKVLEIAAKMPYLYIANNFWNLDYVVGAEEYREVHPPTYGFTMSEGLLDGPWFAMGRNIREGNAFDDQFNRRVSKVKGLNTVTYHLTLYKDFGLPGVLIGSFVIGILLGLLYARARATQAPHWAGVYAFLSFFVVHSVFGFMTESPPYSYGFILFLSTLYLAARSRPARAFAVPAHPA